MALLCRRFCKRQKYFAADFGTVNSRSGFYLVCIVNTLSNDFTWQSFRSPRDFMRFTRSLSRARLCFDSLLA
jgi:hypothetical protein